MSTISIWNTGYKIIMKRLKISKSKVDVELVLKVKEQN
jgi:hypothetical protein